MKWKYTLHYDCTTNPLSCAPVRVFIRKLCIIQQNNTHIKQAIICQQKKNVAQMVIFVAFVTK